MVQGGPLWTTDAAKSSKTLSNFRKIVGWLDGDSASSVWGMRISVSYSAHISHIGPRRSFKVSSAPRHYACERSFSCWKKSRVGPNYSDRLRCCPIGVLKFSAIFLKSSARKEGSQVSQRMGAPSSERCAVSVRFCCPSQVFCPRECFKISYSTRHRGYERVLLC